MRKSTPVSVRLADDVYRAVREMARRASRPVSFVVNELATEALKMRRCPGIVFAGPPENRRARVEGTGLDVWEVIAVYRSCRKSKKRTLRLLGHLREQQLDATLRYYQAYREEIDALIAENERPQEEWEQLYPHLIRAPR